MHAGNVFAGGSERPRRHLVPRWAKFGVIGLVAFAIAGATVAWFMLRSPSTPVDVTEAVDRYREEEREQTPATTDPGLASLPAEGVYVYATEGFAHVDVLNGAEHTYPAESTMTIQHTECGFIHRWVPIEEHWEEDEVCVTDAGFERRTHAVHHEFFGMSDQREYQCESGYLLFPADPDIGDSWPTSCATETSTVAGTGEVVGFEIKAVDGRSVETIHVRTTEENNGVDVGPSRTDYWLRMTDGLLVERTSESDTTTDSPVGTAHFTAETSLRLVSLTPRT